MLSFRALTLADLDTVRPFLGSNPDRLCDLTPGGIYLWRDFYRTEFAIQNGILYFKVDYPAFGSVFTLPRGGDQREEYVQLREYCLNRGIPLDLYPIPGSEIGPLLAAMPEAEATADRNSFDYLYRSEDLKYFRGKKLAGQRNHVNHFLRDYGNWSFQELSEADAAEAGTFLDRYEEGNRKDVAAFREDMRRTRELLTAFRQYGLVGGVLRAEGRIVGLSFAEVMGDTLFVHIEKADRACPGAYQMLVSQFTQRFAVEGVDYVNREDDTGDEGLRTSKLSYHPIALLEKYIVRVPL